MIRKRFLAVSHGVSSVRTARAAVGLAVACSVTALSGCTREVIPNTDVEDTTANREVLEFVEEYRHAMEDRNVKKLISMAAPSYYDDNGTPQSDDDFDYERLKKELISLKDRTLEVRYEIKYRRVIREGERIMVDYTYTGRFRLATPEGDRWLRRLSDNRLVLVSRGSEYQILSGM